MLTPRAHVFGIVVLAAGAGACASIWGFSDSTLLPDDAGPSDGSVDATVDRAAPLDVGLADAGRDAPSSELDAGIDAAADQASDAALDAPGDQASDAAFDAPCNAFCAEAPPPGWSGPYVIYEGVPSAGPPAPCASPFVLAYDGVANPDPSARASCTCSCDPPDGGGCVAPGVTLYASASCAPNKECLTVDASTATCLNFDPMCGGAHASIGPVTAVHGTCAPRATTSVPDAGWQNDVRLCDVGGAGPSGACSPGFACVPPASAGGLRFEGTYCVARSAVAPLPCPDAVYSHPRVYYDTSTDSRGCTPCACGAPAATCAGGSVTTFGNAGCAQPAGPLGASTPCDNLGGAKSAQYANDAVFAGGACGTDGGASEGQVTPTGPTTICCTQ